MSGYTMNEALISSSNTLLLNSSQSVHGDGACAALVSQYPADETNFLGITYSQSAYERLDTWVEDESSYPANTTIIDVGTGTRSAASDSTGAIDFPPDPFIIKTLADETDFQGLGTLVVDELSEWKKNENQTVLCFHSVTSLLEHSDQETAFKVLHLFTSRCKTTNINAHYHMNPEAHGEEAIQLFSELFDTIVEIDEKGDLTANTQYPPSENTL